MPGFLSGSGTLIYNGVTFPPCLTTRVQTQYIRDSAGRHIKYVRHSITVEVVFHTASGDSTPPDEVAIDATDTLDTASTGFPRIRKALAESGKLLIFTGKGFGEDFTINTSIQDVAFGPIPEVLSWEPIGSDQAARCVWTVSVQIPETSDPNPNKERLVEMNYGISWDIGESGLTRRMIQGSMELAVHRDMISPYKGTRSVDRYWENFKAEIPLGFSRIQQNRTLSPDHRSLQFSIVDEEIASDNPYYPGTIRPRVTHSVNSAGLSFQKWINTLSGTIEVAAGVPRWFAWAAFLLVLKKRLRAGTLASLKDSSECPDPSAGVQLIQDISISEEVFGRSTSFSVAWLLTTDLNSLFKATGLWTVNDEVSWAGYRQSMLSYGAWAPRGNARMLHNATDDAIVAFDGARSITVGAQTNRLVGENGQALLKQPCPSAKLSWLVFDNEIELIEDSQNVHHKVLTEPEQQSNTTPPPGQEQPINQSGDTQDPPSYRRSDTTYKVRMRGYAMRVCYEVPDMHLQTYGGKKVSEDSSASKQVKRKMSTLHHPVFYSRWDKTYIVHGTPLTTDSKGNINPDCYGAK